MDWREEYDNMTLDELEECETELMNEYERICKNEYERERNEEDFDRDERNQCYEEWCYVEDLVCELRDSE